MGVDDVVGLRHPRFVHHARQNEIAVQIPEVEFLFVDFGVGVPDVNGGVAYLTAVFDPRLVAIGVENGRRVRALVPRFVEHGPLFGGRCCGPIGAIVDVGSWPRAVGLNH